MCVVGSMLKGLLGRVDDGRFNRAPTGLQAARGAGRRGGFYGDKRYRVAIEQRGTRLVAWYSCDDEVARGILYQNTVFGAWQSRQPL